MIHSKAHRLKPLLILFLFLYIVYGACVVFGEELSHENSDGTTKVTARIEKDSEQPTTEEIPDSTETPDDNPPIPTGEKLALGFLFLIIAAGTAVIIVTCRGTSNYKQ